MARVEVLQPNQQRTRHKRTPSFPIAGVMRPFGLYPLMIHPVMPGETMNSFSLKWRLLSKPLVNPLAGAWLETWLVYVKFTDIERSLSEMFVKDTVSTTGYTAAGDTPRTFTKTGGIDWVKMCLDRLHEAYFIHDNETARTIDGVPQVKLNAKTWMQNIMFRPAESAIDTTDVFDQQAELGAFEMMQMMSMQELTYEKYLQQFGVRSVREGIGEPEILRYSRSWSLPTNSVEPSDGSPSTALFFSNELKLEKAKRFNEPGFVMAVSALRPKMFHKYQVASMVQNLWGFSDFFPIYNSNDPNAAIRVINTDDGVFDAAANAAEGSDELWYDHNDILNHGEQFVNEDFGSLPYTLPAATAPSLLAADAPEDLRGEYCTSTDVDALFVGTPGTTGYCQYDGMAMCDIRGHTQDLIR